MNEDKIVRAQASLHFIWNAACSTLSWAPVGNDARLPRKPEPTHKNYSWVCCEGGREVSRQVSCYRPFSIRDALRRELNWNHRHVAKHTNDLRDGGKGSLQ